MRTGGYELAMGDKAAATVLEAEILARRHGHAHVTPLHVASAILSCTSGARGLLLASSVHQLREEDLPPCFDGALSRLPVASPPPPAATSHSHTVAPRLPLSNALVAALKRAKILQTGGCRRGRRRLLADVKIELEHLIVSIVDDPGVHRAMKQAGSLSWVKPNVVEKRGSPEQSNQTRAGRSLCREENHDMPLAVKISCHSSGDHASLGERREVFTAFVGQSETTPSLLWWIPQAAIPTSRSTNLQATCRKQKFKELSATNFKIMCDALERRIPWHKHIAPGIACVVLRCRSGMMRRARSLTSSTTWLLFQGSDCYAKKEMAQELANLIFGSYNELSCLDSRERFSNGNRAHNRKRSRDGDNTYVMRRLLEVVRENTHGVVFINGVNQLDFESGLAIRNLIATGRMGCNGPDMVNLEDYIVVLSTEETSCSGTMASCTLLNREIINTQNQKGKGVAPQYFGLDLNTCAEDLGEEQEKFVGNNVEIMTILDGVFRFD